MKNYSHGWPRILWEGNSTVDLGDASINPSDQTPTFDATKEIMRWFGTFKLSDDARAPMPKPLVKDSLAGLGDIDAIIKELSEKIDAADQSDEAAEAVQSTGKPRDEL